MKKTVSEEKLRKLIREALKKSNLREVVAPNVFESECILTVPVAENVTDILTKNTGSTSKINIVRAIEKGLKSLRDPLIVARQRGITVKELFS